MPRLLLRWSPVWLGTFALAATWTRTSVHCHVQQTALLLGGDFLLPYLRYPGGLAEYIALPLGLLGSNDWAGAGVVAAMGACFAGIGAGLLDPSERAGAGALILLHAPAVLLLALILDYLFPLAIAVRLLLAGTALLLYRCRGRRLARPAGTALAAVALAVALYYAAGGAAAWMWLAAVWASDLGSPRSLRSWAGALAALAAVGAAVLGGHRWLFLTDWRDAAWLLAPRLPHFLTYRPGGAMWLLCGWLPLVALAGRRPWPAALTAGGARAVGALPPADRVPRLTAAVARARRWPAGLRLAVGYVLLASAAAGLVLPRLDSLPRRRAQADYHAARGEWDRVIAQVRGAKEFDPILSALWCRALAHTGRLGEDLLVYPQLLGIDGVFPDKFATGRTAMPSSDLYYDLGYISAAERWACEAQTLQPLGPRILERLATAALIKGDWRLASKYVHVLARNPWCRTRAAALAALLSDTTLAQSHSVLAAKRRQMPTGGIIPGEPHESLELLLRHDPTNRMAYEYLLTCYLLTHELGSFVSRLADWRQHGYAEVPVLYQEAAIAAHALQVPGAGPLLASLPLAPAVMERFAQFTATLARHDGNLANARRELMSRFAGTYWVYLTYQSPLVTKVQLLAREVL